MGRDHAGAGAGRRRRAGRPASTTSSSCAVRSSPSSRPGPTSTSRPASTSTCAALSRPSASACRCSSRARSSTSARRSGPIDDGVCDGVEMTRAQIADPDLVAKLRAGHAERIRPCIRCNQMCQVRDARNPIVTCIGEPIGGPRDRGPGLDPPARTRSVGRRRRRRSGRSGGGAGRRAAWAPRHDSSSARDRLGGVAGGRGTERRPGRVAGGRGRAARRRRAARAPPTSRTATDVVVQCTGARPGRPDYEVDGRRASVVDVADVRAGAAELPAEGDVVMFDPIGGPIGVALAEELGAAAVLVTQDQHRRQRAVSHGRPRPGQHAAGPGRRAHRTADAAPRCCAPATSIVEDRFSGERRTIAVRRRRRLRLPPPRRPPPRRHGPGRRLRGAAHDPRSGARGPRAWPWRS